MHNIDRGYNSDSGHHIVVVQ